MYCLKCGRDTTDDHVFCDNCQNAMEQCPVKPGTPVHLPHRKAAPVAKKPPSRKRTLSQEEQISLLRRSLRRCRIFALVLLVVLSLLSVLLIREFTNNDVPAIGQNYTIDTNWDTD